MGGNLMFALNVGIFLKILKGVILLQGCLYFGKYKYTKLIKYAEFDT
jgi:hypothetical protein